jgi:hypothetical protein
MLKLQERRDVDLLGGGLVYKLKVPLGYQMILDPKGVQTFYGRKSQKK